MNNEMNFTDYLSILYKWKKFIFINLIIVIIIATFIAFLIPKTYKATASVILAPENSMSMSGLSSLMSNNSALSLGAKLFGVSSTNEDLILGILNSRTVMEKIISKFDLYKYYDMDDERNLDLLLKKMSGDFIFDPNEFGLIEVSVINKNPELSAQIANYLVSLADSINIELGITSAKNNRIFVEKRYKKNLTDLKSAEDSMHTFQKKYGVFAVPEQLEASVKAAAEIEGVFTQKDIMLQLMKEGGETNTPQYFGLLAEVNLLKKKINELKYADKLSSVSNILIPFPKAPDIVMEYFKFYREVEIQGKILQFTLPMYEQALLDEQKSAPTLLSIDNAIAPQLKYSPKRAVIILGIFLIFLILIVFIVFSFESILIVESKKRNLFQNKLNELLIKVINIYKLKI